MVGVIQHYSHRERFEVGVMYQYIIKQIKSFVDYCYIVFVIKTSKNKKCFEVASSEEDKDKVYGFRYKVYHQDYGRVVDGLNHQKKIICDEIDNRDNTLLIYQKNAKGIHATMRCVIWSPKTMPREIKQSFGLEQFSWVDDYVIVELGRLMVDMHNHTARETVELIVKVLEYLESEHQCAIIIASCKPGLVGRYQKFGIVPYSERLMSYPDGIEVLLAGAMEKSFVKSVHSPCHYLLKFKNPILPEQSEALRNNKTCIDVRAKSLKYKLDSLCEKQVISNKRTTAILKLAVDYGAYAIAINENVKLIQKHIKEFNIYFVLSGSLNVELSNNIKVTIQAGEFLGDTTHSNKRMFSAYADKAEVLVIRRSALIGLRRYHPYLYIQMMHELAGFSCNLIDAHSSDSNMNKKQQVPKDQVSLAQE